MAEHVKDYDGLIVGVDPVTERVLKAGEKLRAVAKYGVGVDNIDTAYAETRGIKVSRTVAANANAVADYSFALLMDVARRLAEIDKACRQNDWSKKIALDIYGKKIGILGLGAIGKGMVKRAKGFDMEVYGYDKYKDEQFIKEYDVNFTDVETIVKECDFITIHIPLLPETEHLIDAEMLSKAKDNLVIVNAARGGIIDEEALYEACKSHQIYGAGIDAFEIEPARNSKLLELDNVVVGSHTAASTIGATNTMSKMAVENIIKDLEM
jgi:D-3-phosphoglycerate dehydrogenase